MKKNLIEELKRIHSITYGEKVIEEQNLLDRILSDVGLKDDAKKVDDPKKADLVSSDVEEFFNNLESIDGPLFQQSYGGMEYQKDVESVQMGLILLGYELPRFGVDGLFGPETAMAVNKFKTDNNITDNEINENINEVALIAPVPTQRVSSNYGEKRGDITHPGVDISVPSGTEIKSPADGKVLDARFKSGACGGTIQIEHGNGFVSRYCHCKDIRVSIGDMVKQGDVVGLTGGAANDVGKGNSRGAHLHFELKKNGALVDPLDYIGAEAGTYDLSKEGGKSKATISPQMVQVMIGKLKERGVTSEELSKLIDSVKTGGGANFTDIDLTTEEGKEKYTKICQKFINTRSSNLLGITGEMLTKGAVRAFERYKRFVPAELALAQLATEGGFSSNPDARPIKTKNPFNVGNVDDGTDVYENDVQSGINKYYELIAKNYLGRGKTANDLATNFVNKDGNRYASSTEYERSINQIASQANRIAQTVA